MDALPLVVGGLVGAGVAIFAGPSIFPYPDEKSYRREAAALGSEGGSSRFLLKPGQTACDPGLQDVQMGFFSGICLSPQNAQKLKEERRAATRNQTITFVALTALGIGAGYLYAKSSPRR